MEWTYEGPDASDKDKYRFLVGDTLDNKPVLSDVEIEYVIKTYSSHNERLYHLYSAMANIFGRASQTWLGPSREDPEQRISYYKEKAAHYGRLCSAGGISFGGDGPKSFRKGLHDYVGGR